MRHTSKFIDLALFGVFVLTYLLSWFSWFNGFMTVNSSSHKVFSFSSGVNTSLQQTLFLGILLILFIFISFGANARYKGYLESLLGLASLSTILVMFLATRDKFYTGLVNFNASGSMLLSKAVSKLLRHNYHVSIGGSFHVTWILWVVVLNAVVLVLDGIHTTYKHSSESTPPLSSEGSDVDYNI
jgi:hypothetical protein